MFFADALNSRMVLLLLVLLGLSAGQRSACLTQAVIDAGGQGTNCVASDVQVSQVVALSVFNLQGVNQAMECNQGEYIYIVLNATVSASDTGGGGKTRYDLGEKADAVCF